MKKIFIISLMLVLLVSCGPLKFNQETNQPGNFNLGSFGKIERGILNKAFVEKSLPQLGKKIKIASEKRSINKRIKQKVEQFYPYEKFNFQLSDSSHNGSPFYFFEIADEVGFLEAVNNSQNEELLEYLRITNNNKVITGLSIYFPEEVSDLIDQSIAMYLVNDSENSYKIELQELNGRLHTIDFSQGFAFKYSYKELCWKENYRRVAELGVLIKVGKSCPGQSFKNPEKSNKTNWFDSIK